MRSFDNVLSLMRFGERQDVCERGEPSAALTPAQSSPRATFTLGRSVRSRKQDRSLLAAESEPSESCGAALSTSFEADGCSLQRVLPAGQKTFM